MLQRESRHRNFESLYRRLAVPGLLAALVASAHDASAQRRSTTTAAAPTSTPAARNADPREDAFAVWLLEAGRNMVVSAHGRLVGPRWEDPAVLRHLARMRAPGTDRISALGPNPHMVVVQMSVSARAPNGDWVEGCTMALPDGRLRWCALSAGAGHGDGEPPSRFDLVIAQGAPAWSGIVARMLEVVRGTCNFPLADAADLVGFAPEILREMQVLIPRVPAGCVTARALTSSLTPRSREIAINVTIRGNGQVAYLRSHPDVAATYVSVRVGQVIVEPEPAPSAARAAAATDGGASASADGGQAP